MPSFTFSEREPSFTVRRAVPFELRFRITGTPQPGVQTRFWHVKLPGPGKPRRTQITEGKAGAHKGVYVVELSGLGEDNRPDAFDPMRLNLPDDGVHVVRYGFEAGVVEVNGLKGKTQKVALTDQEVEIVFGVERLDLEIKAPLGMTIEGDFVPAQAQQPPFPPVQPPVTPPTPPVTPPAAPPGGVSPRDQLVADVEAALLRYTLARGEDPALAAIAAAFFAYLRARR